MWISVTNLNTIRPVSLDFL